MCLLTLAVIDALSIPGVAISLMAQSFIPGAICTALAVIAIVPISVIGSTLKSILVAACYRYAVTGQTPGRFEVTVLASAFAPKRK